MNENKSESLINQIRLDVIYKLQGKEIDKLSSCKSEQETLSVLKKIDRTNSWKKKSTGAL